MKINKVHHLDEHQEEVFKRIQEQLRDDIKLENNFDPSKLKTCAGVDLAYWKHGDTQYGVCSIIVIDMTTHEIIEKTSKSGVVDTPYVAGYLAFRELPLIIEAVESLVHEPDIFMFDGNGYLHSRNMGIATHASFFIEKPTIGVAKSYLKVGNKEYEMPDTKAGSYTDIIVDDKIIGRCLRTRDHVKPVFVSCGNNIDLDTTVDLIMKMVDTKSSRLPIPVRLADIETRVLREEHMSESDTI